MRQRWGLLGLLVAFGAAGFALWVFGMSGASGPEEAHGRDRGPDAPEAVIETPVELSRPVSLPTGEATSTGALSSTGSSRDVLSAAPTTPEDGPGGIALVLHCTIGAQGQPVERVFFRFQDRNRALRFWGSTRVEDGTLRIEVERDRVQGLRAGSRSGAVVLANWKLHLAESKQGLGAVATGLLDREAPFRGAVVELDAFDWDAIQRAGDVGSVDLGPRELAIPRTIGEVHFTGDWTEHARLVVELGPRPDAADGRSSSRSGRVPRWSGRVPAREAPIRFWSYTMPETWHAHATPDIPAFEVRQALERGEQIRTRIRDQRSGGARLELHRPAR